VVGGGRITHEKVGNQRKKKNLKKKKNANETYQQLQKLSSYCF
jgi:hypothetical protein